MNKSFSVSLGCHIIVLLSLSVCWTSFPFRKQEAPTILSSYVVSSSLEVLKKSAPLIRKTWRSERQKNSPQENLKTKKTIENILLKILHNKIAEKLSYPEEALLLKQIGTVKIGLLLLPNGQMTHIALLKSSGIDSMDSAAMTAVGAIPAIEEAHFYLSKAEFFSVDVVFQT